MEQEITKRRQQVVYDQKWKKFLRRSWIFRHIPFLEFAFAAGSLATGNIRPESDCDVLIGVRFGRIFTCRFFTVILSGLFGWRRKKLSHQEEAVDKICLNHFITQKSLRLSPPHNDYWKMLYKNLVPIFGKKEVIQLFWDANKDWMKEIPDYKDDLRHLYQKPFWFTKTLEKLLAGKIGNWIENFLKKSQIFRIESGLKNGAAGYQPRIVYNDSELEFHPDTQRIQDFLHRNLQS